MVSKDYNYEAIQENGAWEEFDGGEEALSFSDLPLNSNFSIDDYPKEYQDSSFDQDNFFEFCSEDFTSSATNYHPANHIIFCGKLIPTSHKTQKQEIIESISPRNSKKGCIFPWKSSSFKLPKREKRYKACKSFPGVQDHPYSKNEVSSKRANNSAKSRWYLFGRFPMEMELRDIKTRQSKRKPATMFQYDNKSEMKNQKTKRLKGFWGLLRIFVFA